MLRGNGREKEPVVGGGRMEGRANGAMEILITPFEAEMLRVVLEAMRDCCEDEPRRLSSRPNRQSSPLRVADRRDS
jgi:hypothetical protein